MSGARDQREAGGWTGTMAPGHVWAQFDALPRGMKRLFWDAPYDYTAAPVYDLMKMGADLRKFAAAMRETMAEDVAREACALYGPTHPQARRR